MFGDIQKQAEEMQKRWDKIEELKAQLEDQIQPGGSIEEATLSTAKIVLLLVEQLKPMSALDSAQFEEGMKNILDAFTGGKHGK